MSEFMSECELFDVKVFTKRDSDEDIKICEFQMTKECLLRAGQILDEAKSDKFFAIFETTVGYWTFPAGDIRGIEFVRHEKQKDSTGIELIRKEGVFQNFNLKPVSQIAADALFQAGVQGTFTVTVDLGIAQKYLIGDEERTVFTDTFHAPAQGMIEYPLNDKVTRVIERGPLSEIRPGTAG